MRLVILGGPGAGKGTQSERLCRQLSIPWISTGDILRTAIAAKDSDGECQTELGRQAQAYLEQGEFVPDEIMIQFMRQRLQQPDTDKGWLMEGYPRTAFQAEELDFLLDELGQNLNHAISLEVPVATLTSRSLARARTDDEPEKIQRRIDLYQERTIPLLEYYEMRELTSQSSTFSLLRINGEQSIEQVQEEILKKLGVEG